MQSTGDLPTLIESAPRDDIRDTLATEPLPVSEFPWVEVLIGVSVAVLIALLVIGLRRRFRPRPAESTETRARRRLATLASHTAPDPRAFHAPSCSASCSHTSKRVSACHPRG